MSLYNNVPGCYTSCGFLRTGNMQKAVYLTKEVF